MQKYVMMLFMMLIFGLIGIGIGSLFEPKLQTKPEILQVVNPFSYDQISLKNNEDSSLVRLETEDGQFFCSGVVITNELLLTAAHCLIHQDMYGRVELSDETINVVSEKTPKKKQLKIQAKAWVANARLDYALVKGNFKRFNKAKIDYSNTAMFRVSDNVVACGFPVASTNSICYPLRKRDNKELAKGFSYGFLGFLYPGMSGGPVLDRHSNIVFGINSAVDSDKEEVVIAPIIGLKELIEQGNKKNN